MKIGEAASEAALFAVHPQWPAAFAKALMHWADLTSSEPIT
jgi:hypothetical protein